MPQEGETYAMAIASVEYDCQAETRRLYEAEGKENLLGEDGVPDSLREWLTVSKDKCVGTGGHRDTARRRLKAQVYAVLLNMNHRQQEA